MSNHFTYEIDERNLRVKLKDYELPYKEEAWQKFEHATFTQHKIDEANSKTKLQISLNRNIILPIIFAGIIILFSILLFNFISIKNPSNKQKAEETKSLEVMPENKTKGIITTKSTTPVQTSDTLKNRAAEPKIEVGQKTSESGKPNLATTEITKISPAISKVDSSHNENIMSSNKPLKKKRKKNSQEIVETEHLPDIHPVLKPEEKEPEIRQN